MAKKYPFKDDEIYEYDANSGNYDLQEEELPEKLQQNVKKKGASSVSVFGSDMDILTKLKLEARQNLNLSNRNPNESIQSRYSSTGKTFLNDSELGINLQFDGQSDFSSRTPIARMWTSLQLERYTDRRRWSKHSDGDYKRDAKKYAYTVRGNSVFEQNIHKHDRIIYVVGNHTMNEFSGRPNEPRTGNTTGTSLGKKLLPQMSETNQNEYFMPPAGITSVTMETEGALGLIKKTSVNFNVNNFHDFENIFQRYFLRPGAQIFVDFGWSSVPLYDPKSLCYDDYKKGRELDELLYGTDGIVTSAAGDLDVIQGFVTEFNSKLTTDGVYECSLELVSRNNSLMEASFMGGDASQKKRMLATIDSVILNFAAKHFGANMIGQNKMYDNTNMDTQNELMYTFGKERLQSRGTGGKTKNVKIPASKEVLLTGVYWQTQYAKDPEDEENPDELKEVPASDKNIYIMWGLFEDLILNEQFGFGRDKKDVLFGNDVSIRFDSSNSFVSYSKLLEQSTFMAKAEAFDFRYPETWDKTYNTYRKKVNVNRLTTNGKYKKKTDIENYNTWTDLDKHLRRVPLREIFVNLSVIKESIEKKNDVKGIMKEVLDRLKTASGDVWDLQLGGGRKDGSVVSAIDRNFVQAERDDLGGTSYLDKMFMFKPHSPDSIVKDMNLEFAMPSNDMGNMIAINSGAGGNSVFAVNKSVDRNLAMSIFNELEGDVNAQYLPMMGTYPMEKYTKKISEGYIVDSLYNDDDIIFSGDSETSNAILSEFGSVNASSYEKKTIKRLGKEKWNDLQMINMTEEEIEEAGGDDEDIEAAKARKEELEPKESDFLNDTDQLASGLEDYYKLLAKSSYFFLNTSSLLPISISLTIDGITSLNVGNLFKVDYLPKMYRETVYFQITSLKQDISQEGWKTEIEALMRIAPVAKKNAGIYAESTNIYLSKKALTDGVDINVANKQCFKSKVKDSSTLFPFVSKLKVLGTGDDFDLGMTDYIMSFEASAEYIVFKGDFKSNVTTSSDQEVKWGVGKGYIHWGFPWGKDASYWDDNWLHNVDFYCARYPDFFISGLQDAKTSKAERGGWDFYYNYWTCNMIPGNKYIIQVSKNNNAVIYPYPYKNGKLDEKDLQMLQWHIDGIFHMYAGKYYKNLNYRPISSIWSRMKKAQAHMDQKTKGFYVRGRKPSWVNKASFWIKSVVDLKYRRQSD